MDTRRDFLKKAALLSGAAGLWEALPISIQNALAIDPEQGSTYLDAAHVVILMQENRSFDHSFGTLPGVRGFNDPRAITLPDQKPIWFQTNGAGETYAPFRLNIKETNATWMGSLPHSWTDQVDARNNGTCDKWLIAKPSGHRDYSKMPLTMGYYSRLDIPFYYALADAFTVCDQNFCSSLTGTTPNRLYLWTGTIREKQTADVFANVRNEEVDYGAEASWTTFPERLEDLGISWKIYQNELSLQSGLGDEEDGWLANFTDNPIEWFTQYRVRFATGHRNYLANMVKTLPTEIETLEAKVKSQSEGAEAEKLKKQIADKTALLSQLKEEHAKWSTENWEKLSQRDKNLHNKAFCINTGDPNYRELTTLAYKDGETERKVQVPKGDVLHQFRQDVNKGTLPTVSWIVASATFSDHPGSAWYGAWYLSECLEILTKNPEVWKKTIFILTYDENDGYFDHVPPFVPPHPTKPETGLVSKGIDTSVEYVLLEQDMKRKPKARARESSIGLGYRVPMVIASPWSRGGCVNSQVFDHTSILQFLETFLSHKTGKTVEEPNITAWRRTVCGDLTSAFQPYNGEKIAIPAFVARDPFIEGIHKAQFKKPPTDYKALTKEEVEQVKKSPTSYPLMAKQEKGTRRSAPLPYQLYSEGALTSDKTQVAIQFEARNEIFGKQSAGSPFTVYAFGKPGDVKVRSYAVTAGDKLEDTWKLTDFAGNAYHLQVHGPNGFFREFQGSDEDPAVDIQVGYSRDARNAKALTGAVEVTIVNRDNKSITVELHDNAYKSGDQKKTIPTGGKTVLVLKTDRSFGWYDFTLRLSDRKPFEKRYAGRVETGKWSYSDPAMGG